MIVKLVLLIVEGVVLGNVFVDFVGFDTGLLFRRAVRVCPSAES